MAERQDESRTEQATMRVTPSEKRAIQLVALYRDVAEADVLRWGTIDQIVEEADRIRAARAGSAA